MVYGVDERIRRAEEIYARRQSLRAKTKKETVNNSEPKNLKLFKKLGLQIIICVLIYYAFYLVNTTNYSFSDETLGKTKEIISHDFDFLQVFNSISEYVNDFLYPEKKEEANIENTEESKQNSDEQTDQVSVVENNEGTSNNENEGNIDEENVNQSEVQHTEESETERIKNKYEFILPASRKNFIRIWDKRSNV